MNDETTGLKTLDLAGPGIGDYDELEKILPGAYSSLLDPRETRAALTEWVGLVEPTLKHLLPGAPGLARGADLPGARP